MAAEIATREAATAEAAAKAQEAAATAEAKKNRQEALKAAEAAEAAKAAAERQAAAAAAAAKAKGKQAQEAQKDNAAGGSTSDTITIAHHALNNDLPPETDDWELSEGGLPEGSTLSGSKALLEDPPEDEADSKKHKKIDKGKGSKGDPTPTA